jgi:hypothetical protein
MKTRRILLATGLGLLIFSAGHRVRANVGVQAESAAYGGETSGGWVCGPSATLKYGGVGSSVTVSQREADAPQGRGAMVNVAVAGERQADQLIQGPSCVENSCSSALPPAGLLLGGRARAGYEWRYVDILGGLGLYQGYNSNTDTKPSLEAYPDIEMHAGSLQSAYFVFGGGASTVTTLLRPGLYTGGSFTSKEGFGLDVRGGIYRMGPSLLDNIGPRGDLGVRTPFPFVDELKLRFGGALGWSGVAGAPTDFEASLGVLATL